METAKIVYETELITESTHIKSGQKIITDAPVDNNGKGSAFSPTDLVSSALASCMLTLIAIKGNQHQFIPGNIEAFVYKTMGVNPRRIIKIEVKLRFENDFSEKIKTIIEDAALNCPVAKSLHPEINQEVTFSYGNAN